MIYERCVSDYLDLMQNLMRPDTWSPSRSREVVAALADAFRAYPVMRYIIGEAGDGYDRRLHLLIGLFVAGRVLRGNPILAIEEGGLTVAVATLTPPGEQQELPELLAVWRTEIANGGAVDRVRVGREGSRMRKIPSWRASHSSGRNPVRSRRRV